MTQRIALVTGGSRGLGKNAALKLAAKGTDILLTYHSNRQAALDVVAEIEQKGGQSGSISAERRGYLKF
ncbi:oxidoreductase [Klebsiella variicola]|nr:oxidoreductase [Klebsiella variicola]